MKLRKLKVGDALEAGKWYAYSDREDGLFKIGKRLHSCRVGNRAYFEHFEVLDFNPDDIEIQPDPRPGELWRWRYGSEITVAYLKGDRLFTPDGVPFAADDGRWKPIRLLWVRPEGREK